jgi:hypothetical protein
LKQPSHEELKRNVRKVKVLTLDEIAEAVEEEHERVRVRAFAIAAGSAGGTEAPTEKGRRRNAGGGVIVEVAGIDSFAGKKSAAQNIDVEYLLWGFSQKVQLAGVSSLVGHAVVCLLFPTPALHTHWVGVPGLTFILSCPIRAVISQNWGGPPEILLCIFENKFNLRRCESLSVLLAFAAEVCFQMLPRLTMHKHTLPLAGKFGLYGSVCGVGVAGISIPSPYGPPSPSKKTNREHFRHELSQRLVAIECVVRCEF